MSRARVTVPKVDPMDTYAVLRRLVDGEPGGCRGGVPVSEIITQLATVADEQGMQVCEDLYVLASAAREEEDNHITGQEGR